MALQRGCIDAAVVLIRNGALIDGKDGKGGIPLSYIIESKPEEWPKYAGVTQLLLDKGLDVNAGDGQGVTPLHRAAAAGREDIVSLFFAHGGDINVKDNNGRTLLQYAVASGSKDIVSLFLAHGADIDGKDDTGRTLLHYAAGASVPYAESHSNPDIVRLLLGKEINVDEVDSQLKKLVSAGSDVNVQDEHGIAPLHIAASAGHSNTVELLVVQGACLDMKDNAGRTPLHYAAGAALETKQGHKWKPGTSSENIEIVELLIEKGADVNVKDTYGLTPLHYATVDHSTNIMALLLSRNAYVDVKDKAGRAPLHYAVGAVYGKNNTDP